MFAGTAKYPLKRGATEKVTLVGSDLTHNHKTKLEGLTRNIRKM